MAMLRTAMQYVLMFVAAGNPGTVKDIQVKVASARKVFRIMKVRAPTCAHPDCARTSALRKKKKMANAHASAIQWMPAAASARVVDWLPRSGETKPPRLDTAKRNVGARPINLVCCSRSSR